MPWHAHIYWEDLLTRFNGALVNNWWVLTSATCVIDQTAVFVNLGGVERNHYPWHYRLTELHRHPKYNQKTNYANIGLIKLIRPAVFSDRIQPIAFLGKIGDKEDIPFVVAGRGMYSPTDRSDFLLKTDLVSIKNAECDQYFGSEGRILKSHVCAVSPLKMSRTCKGDEGAPLVYFFEGKAFAAGVATDFGSENCQNATPTVSVRLEPFQGWVNRRIKV